MKWFKFPFAVTGSRTAVPEDLQPSGDVSYEEGYGIDYSRDPLVDPLAKRIERDKYNQILYDITNWIRDLTVIGTPDFITTAQNGGVPYAYRAGARVMFDNGTSGYVRWESLVGTNTSSPLSDPTKWRRVGLFASVIETVAGIIDYAAVTPKSLKDSGFVRIVETAYQNYTGSGTGGGVNKQYIFINSSGVVPKHYEFYARCKANQSGYVVGDIVPLNSGGMQGTSGSMYGYSPKQINAGVDVVLYVDTNHGVASHEWASDGIFQLANNSWEIKCVFFI